MGKSYANGPIPSKLWKLIQDQQRSLTDGFCLLLFVFLSVAMFSLAVYSGLHDGYNNFAKLSDSDGKICGVDYVNNRYLYFVSLYPDSISRRVCVSQCPNSSNFTLNCSFNSKVPNCNQTFSSNLAINMEIYPTQLFWDRLCLPQPQNLRYLLFGSFGIGNENVNLLLNNWKLYIIIIPVTILITILLMVLIQYTACFTIYVIILGIVAILIFCAYLFLFCIAFGGSQSNAFLGISYHQLYYIGMTLCLLLALTILIALCCFRKRINISVKIIKASARFVNQHFYLILISVFKMLFIFIFLVLWFVQLWGIFQFKEMMFKNYNVNVTETQNKAIEVGIIALHGFYLLWGLCFISEGGSFIISAAVTNWYFNKDYVCTSSVSRFMNYHSGSVAVGSFYIALFWFLKLVYEWIKPNSEQENSLCGKISKCLDCVCCLCVTYIFTIMNRGAYAFINISGKTFCQSSLKVFSLRANQPVLSGVMVFLEIIFSLVLRIQIVAITVACAYYLITSHYFVDSVIFNASPILIVVGLIAFIISQIFVSIYIQAADSIVVSFLVDKQYGDEENNCPEELKEYLEQTRKNDGEID